MDGGQSGTETLLYVYLYIMSNFELYKHITYSKKMKGKEREKKERERKTKQKEKRTKLNVILFFPESTFHIFRLTIKH